MWIKALRRSGVVLVLISCLMIVSPASAFYPYGFYRPYRAPFCYPACYTYPYGAYRYYGYPYGGYGYPYYYPSYGYGGYGYPQAFGAYAGSDPSAEYLQGTANVIDAQGRYLVDTQQAYLLKEQVRQAQIANQRRAFDEWAYERARTPTLNEQREREQREELRRDLNNPPLTEIWSGSVLNVILADVQGLLSRGIEGGKLALDADVVARLNVSDGKGPDNVGLLRDKGPLSWPVSLKALAPVQETQPLRDRIDQLLAEAKAQAVKGQVRVELLTDLSDCLARLRTCLTKQVTDMSFAQYTESKRFLKDLDAAVQLFKQGKAADYLTGKTAAKSLTVRDLVAHMTDNGLRFAPAAPGDEAAYNAFYQAMVTYARDAMAKVPEK
jgi:hypothetical protein